MPVHKKCKLVQKELLKDDIYRFVVDAKEIAETAKPQTIFRNKSTRECRTTFKKTDKYSQY